MPYDWSAMWAHDAALMRNALPHDTALSRGHGRRETGLAQDPSCIALQIELILIIDRGQGPIIELGAVDRRSTSQEQAAWARGRFNPARPRLHFRSSTSNNSRRTTPSEATLCKALTLPANELPQRLMRRPPFRSFHVTSRASLRPGSWRPDGVPSAFHSVQLDNPVSAVPPRIHNFYLVRVC